MRLKELRKNNKLTQKQVADYLEVGVSTYNQYETARRQPDNETLIKLANFFGVSTDYILGLDSANEITKKTRIPVLGRIPAGIAIEMIEDILDYEDISPAMLTGDKKYFALKIKGDSMEPKFLENDILIIKQQDSCNSGDYCIVAVNGFDATFKKVIKKESGIILQPLNPNYEPIIYDNEQIEKLPVKILGVVIEIRRSI